ncbi:MAG TPA: amidohydrolase family protein [Spirochaetia bacterium]|nr:amidohydrolase family protein [Spirochaetia bacterium]
MIIDFHTHVGDIRSTDRMDHTPVTFENLIERLDDEGIDKAVLLPLGGTPEAAQFPALFSPYPDIVSLLKAASEHADRIVPFGNLDPRMGGMGNKRHDFTGTDFSWILERFTEMGCVGIGEVTANIPFDDPRVISMMKQCGDWDLPVLFHCAPPGLGFYGLIDEAGSPKLERMLQQVPDTTIVGHSTGFWAEVDGNITNETKSTYPEGPITKEGSLPRLLRTYPNLYADISANSGYNALTRDREYGIRFLKEFQDRIIFGTDVCFADKESRMPHLSFLRGLLDEGAIGREIFDKITSGNGLRILKRYKG